MRVTSSWERASKRPEQSLKSSFGTGTTLCCECRSLPDRRRQLHHGDLGEALHSRENGRVVCNDLRVPQVGARQSSARMFARTSEATTGAPSAAGYERVVACPDALQMSCTSCGTPLPRHRTRSELSSEASARTDAVISMVTRACCIL